MIPAPVRYARPSDLEQAFELLAEPDARAIAGGQSLVPLMKLRLARPSVVVDIANLGLRGIGIHDDTLHLGALTTWAELADAAELARPGLAAMSECAASIGDVQVRNRGTIGGSLAHADPASDMPAVLLALGASVRLRSADGERVVPLEDFLEGPFTTALRGGELIAEVTLPVPRRGSGSAYASVEHPASGFALAGAAALTLPTVAGRIALTGIGSRPVLLPPGADVEEATAAVEVFGDRFAGADYRRELAVVVARRALERATTRAAEEQ